MRFQIAQFILKRRWVWLGLVLFLLGLASWRVSHVRFDLSLFAMRLVNDPSVEITEAFKEQFGDISSEFFVVGIESPNGLNTQALEVVSRITSQGAEIPGIRRVSSLSNATDLFPDAEGFAIRSLLEVFPEGPNRFERLAEHVRQNRLLNGRILSADGRFLNIYLRFGTHELNTEKKRREAVRKIEEIVEKEATGFRHYFGGIPYIESQYAELIVDGVISSQIFLILITALLLYFILRSWTATFIPLMISGISVVLTLGVMECLGLPITLISSGVPSVVMVIAIAESTYYVTSYLEQRGKGLHSEKAILETLKEVLVASAASSLTTAVGFFSLYFSNIEMVQGFGIDLGIGIIIEFLVTIFATPALLTVLPISTQGIRQMDSDRSVSRLLSWITGVVEHRRRWIFAISLALCAVSFTGIPRLEIEQRIYDEVDEDHPLRVNFETLKGEIRGYPSVSFSIRSERPGAWEDPEVLKKVKKLQEELASYPGIRTAWSVVDYIEQMNWAFFEGKPEEWRIPESSRLVSLYLMLTESSELPIDAKDLLDSEHRWGMILLDLEDIGSQAVIDFAKKAESRASELLGPDFEARFAGEVIIASHGNMNLIKSMIQSFASSFLMVFPIVAIAFRSIPMTLLSIPINVLPMLLVVSLMGWFGISLRVGTAIVLPIALGIAVNDTLHYFIRYREELHHTHGDRIKAMRRGILGTGRGMLTSSGVLCFGYLALLLPEFVALNHMGIASSLSLFSALLADLFLGPALLIQFFKDGRKEKPH